jgi:uncharacterized phage-associated protein
MTVMRSKSIIIQLFTLLIPSIACATDLHLGRDSGLESADNSTQQTEENRARKRLRSEELSKTQRMALYFIQLLRNNGLPTDKTYLHKFIYFANGLHYSIFNKPLLENFFFDAHEYGPFVHDVQDSYQKLLNISISEDTMINDSDKSICDYIFNALKYYRSGELSAFTHEAGTPWSETRRSHEGVWGKKLIQPELNRKYFRKQETILRFFLHPLLKSPERFKSSSETTKKLLENYMITELSNFRLALQENRFDDIRGFAEHLVDVYRCTNQFSLDLREFERDVFVSSLQTPMEGILSSLLFTENFINNAELDLIYDESFRKRVAISAGLNNISSLYYLGQIFQTFSNEPGDDADLKVQKVQSRLESLANQIIERRALTPNEGNAWHKSYDLSLAYFYLAKYDDAIIWMENALKQVELPVRYRHDLLQRAFYITNDSKYITEALENRFQDFYIQKATTETSSEQTFICYEMVIMDRDLSEAYFKAGRMILRGNYTVPETSPLWSKMGIATSSGNIQLGIALLEKSIKNGVSEALTYYVESYLSDQDKEKKLAACDLAKGMPFAEHQKGELLESQHKLLEAREAYKAAGELIGYPDAMRLSSLEEQKLLEERRKEYKQRLLDELYEDYSNYVQEG